MGNWKKTPPPYVYKNIIIDLYKDWIRLVYLWNRLFHQ